MNRYKSIGTLPVFCPGCSKQLTLPDIGPQLRDPPDEGFVTAVRASLDVECPCGDASGIVYQGRQPVLIWWRPSKPIHFEKTTIEADTIISSAAKPSHPPMFDSNRDVDER